MAYLLSLHLLSLGRRLLHPTCRSVSSARTAEIPTQQLSRNSVREILCVRVVGWSLATVLLILGASGGYVLPYSSYVLAGRNPVFPKTFANDGGDDPSRVGAATDLLMEGVEQLDTIIGFKDGHGHRPRTTTCGNTFPKCVSYTRKVWGEKGKYDPISERARTTINLHSTLTTRNGATWPSQREGGPYRPFLLLSTYP